ncbi:MAG: Hpt domain-containing protein, partial [Oscillospiraceae bacterium]|nr:Hpt domain-containing protein [Oscillospiraceae bacterium]
IKVTAIDKEQQSADDEKALKQLKLYFVKNNQSTFENIKKAIDSGDINLAHRMVHTLKSNAGQIGENKLQETAAKTESKLIDGENKLSEKQADALDTELKAVLEKLAPMLAEAAAQSNAGSADTEKSREIIEKLEPLLKMQKAECMNMTDEIRTIPGAEELAQYVEDFEFAKALDELFVLKKKLEEQQEN